MGHEPETMNPNPTKAMSATATEPAAATSRPTIGQYKGHPMIILNPDDRFPFQFGLNKAKLILRHVEEIRKFVQVTEASAIPAQMVAA